jgi:uncharacterized membrane protein
VTARENRRALLVALVLRGGVLLAAMVTVAGAIPLLLLHGKEYPSYHSFHGTDAPYRSLGAILQGAAHGAPLAVIALGIVVLIGTPITRVLLTMFSFLVERDHMYATLTGLVLVILLYSLLAGFTL